MKIFIGLTEVSGYYSALRQGLIDLGIKADFVSLQEHRFKYDQTNHLPLICRLSRRCVTERVKRLEKNQHEPWFWTILTFLSRVLLFAWAAIKYDVFLLGGGSSFFNYAEFPLLKFLRKKIIYTFHGTDSRPAYIDGFSQDISKINENPVPESMIRGYLSISQRNKKAVERVEKYADVVVNSPAQAQFLSKPYIIGLIAGLPMRSDLFEGNSNDARKGAVKILHSPSHIEGKGTLLIRQAVQSLSNKGYAIEYTEISGKPNAEVIEAIRQCDFVVDQLYSDSPMAGFAAEAATASKPAVVGGYYCDYIADDIPSEWTPPSEFCHPDDIEASIEKLIVDEAYRKALGEKAQKFVKENWTAQAEAKRYLSMIQGNYPDAWLYDPMRNSYVYGMGLPAHKTKTIVKSIIDKHGPEALLLDHNPRLRQLFVDMVGSDARKC